MATVSASLKLFDQFSATMELAQRGMQAALDVAERLKQQLQGRIVLEVDTSAAIASVEQMRNRTQAMGGSSAIQVVIDADSITQKILLIQNQIRNGLNGAAVQITLDEGAVILEATQLKQRIESLLHINPILLTLNSAGVQGQITTLIHTIGGSTRSAIMVQVKLDTTGAMVDAAALRAQIISQIGVIQAEIVITLPPVLSTMLTNLRRLVLQLMLAVRKLRQALNPPPIPPIPPIPPPLPPIPPIPEPGGSGGAGGLLSKLKGIAAAYISIAAARKLAESGIVMQQQENLLGARMGDLKLGKGLFATMVQQANDLNVSAKDLGVTWNSFLPLAQNVGQLKQMAEWSNRLAKLDPAQGMEGATLAMKEIMSGDTQSLVERFEISRGLANQIKTAAKTGDFNQISAAMEKVFVQLKMTKEQIAALNEQPLNQLTGDLSDLGNSFSVFSKNVVEGISEGYVWLKRHIPGAIQTTKDAITKMWLKVEPVLSFLAQGIAIAGIAFLAFWLISVLVNGSLIAMIVNYSLVAFAAVRAAVASATAWAIANWEIALVLIVIALIITAFLYFGGTVDQVVGTIVGSFFFLGSVIWNAIALTLKLVINIVILLGEAFMSSATWAVKAFEMIGDAIMDKLVWTLDLAIKGINLLNKGFNLIKGVNIPMVPTVAEMFGEKKPVNLGGDAMWAATKKIDDFRKKASDAIPLANPVDAYKSGYGFGASITDSVKNGAGYLGDKLKSVAGGFGDMFKVGLGVSDDTKINGNIHRVDEVGKIKDTVDISNEDLKVMRDLAEMKSIQNFVTLTPTVQVTTGDIHEKADINEIIYRINKSLTEEITTSAQGVYN